MFVFTGNRASQFCGDITFAAHRHIVILPCHCFDPRDAMLARVLASSYGPVFVRALGVLNDYALYKSTHSPCQSQVGVLSKRIEPVFGTRASFHLSYTVLKGNSGISEIRVLPSGTLSQTPD